MIEILISFVTNKRLEIEEKMTNRPSEIRTHDLSIQKLSLCPSSYGVSWIFVLILFIYVDLDTITVIIIIQTNKQINDYIEVINQIHIPLIICHFIHLLTPPHKFLSLIYNGIMYVDVFTNPCEMRSCYYIYLNSIAIHFTLDLQ